jgi:MOSC domain-containing protein YiiM
VELLTVSVSDIQRVRYHDRWVDTGIFKKQAGGAHRVGVMGLETDAQADLENHGGVDKAVYVYTVENYRYWEAELGRDLPAGQFGENFMVSGMPDESVHIGDIFRCNDVLLQVTQPRVPCFKLGITVGDADFVGRFHYSGRVGFYLRVLETGTVEAGSVIEAVSRDPAGLDIRDAMLALNQGPRQLEIIDKALAIPALSEAWRVSLTKKRNAKAG